ncbi:MAG: hypothetical protein LBG24_06230 [Treponema sp.]|jgi:hypothetical protein|nr:hypothetical protein [Treponema sp.]
MRKSICLFLIFFLCGTAAADKIGLSVGLYGDGFYLWDTDRKDYFLTPLIEYDHSFGKVDLHLKGEYTFCLTHPFPQFLFAEEKIAVHLPLGSLSEFQFGLQNEQDLLFNPEDHRGRGSGTVEPELSYALFLPPGEISLALGSPWTYRMWGRRDSRFGLDLTAAYSTPFWLGFKVTANFILIPDAVVEGMEAAVNVLQDQFYVELAFNIRESFGYFSLTPEFDYLFNFFTFWVSVEFGNIGYGNTLTIAPALGVKYRF